MIPRDPTHHTNLDKEEQAALRTAIQQAVLSAEGLEEELETNPEAYLRLMARADLAVDETSRLLQESVNQARRAGHSWGAIGQELGVSRQGAQQRFGQTEKEPLESGTRRLLKGANAFNEMGILRVEGDAGHHLVSFGPLYLEVEASQERWEHLRVTAVFMGPLRKQLEQTGWQYVGSWFPYRYFKRPTGVPVPQ